MTLLRTAHARRIDTPSMTVALLAPSSETEGDFGLFDVHMPGGAAGPVPHLHEGFSETFYVLDGVLDVRSGDVRSTAGPGDLLYVPRGGTHTFRPDGGDARFLLLFTPGTAREEYFAEMAALAGWAEPASADEIDAVARRHDQINVRPDPAHDGDRRRPGPAGPWNGR